MNRAIVVLTTGLTAAAFMAACGSSSNTPTPTESSSAPAATPTPVAATPTPTAAPTAVDVSGSWSGQYSGPFNGTFTLTWTQTGSALSGTIKLSSPPDTLNISGNASGSGISFGAVGVVTYSGTVSGSNSMSGSYVDVANGQTGSWSATKS